VIFSHEGILRANSLRCSTEFQSADQAIAGAHQGVLTDDLRDAWKNIAAGSRICIGTKRLEKNQAAPDARFYSEADGALSAMIGKKFCQGA
jgi:hypothetical protein